MARTLHQARSQLFFSGSTIQGGDELNENGDTASLLRGKLSCLRLYYERFKF